MQNIAESEVDRLEAELVALSARMNAAEYVMLERIRELEDVITIQDWTYPQWLAWRLNMATATAYERVRVARALKELPSISGAFAEGRLTYSKVRILTRMATGETDATYLQYALVMSVHQLETLVAKHRKFSTREAEQQMQRRFLQVSEDDDGMFVVKGRLAPDDAAILLKALQAADAEQPRIDALIQVAKAAIEQLATGDDAILRVAHDASCAGEHATVEGIAIPFSTAERLCCENPEKRTISTAQKRVLVERQGGVCFFPGCTHRRYLDGHHVKHWRDGGKTTLDNLCLLCTKHHRLLHEGRFTIDAQRVVRNQHGIVLAHSPALAKADLTSPDLPDVTDLRGRDLWDGGRVDWDTALSALL